MTRRRLLLIGLGLAAVATMALSVAPVRRSLHPVILAFRGKQTVDGRLQEFSAARVRVRDDFADAGVAYPPGRVVLLGLKRERRLEVYAGPVNGPVRRVAVYPVLAASGGPGPKLREGDRQVPEGVYGLESLNPNSRFHAALRVSYPNELDAALARKEGRSDLGGDIMIHGGAASVGCLAMGDPAAEDLFVLAAEAGVGNVTIVLCPADPRVTPLPTRPPEADGGRYDALRAAVSDLPASPPAL